LLRSSDASDAPTCERDALAVFDRHRLVGSDQKSAVSLPSESRSSIASFSHVSTVVTAANEAIALPAPDLQLLESARA
jgi:hypothetical protein